MSRRLFSGSDNEVWSYGEEALAIFTRYMMLREKMRPYLTELMKEAHEKGTPVIRTRGLRQAAGNVGNFYHRK